MIVVAAASISTPACAGGQGRPAQPGGPATSHRSGSAPGQTDQMRYVVAPAGNEARYRVREQLVGFDFPNDAVGVTKDVSGRVIVGHDGRIVRDSSRIVVGVSSLKSDQKRRDGFIQHNTLETVKYPQVDLVPMALDGLTLPMSQGETRTFSLLGDLTVHGVTHPTTWRVTARVDGNDIVGSAATAFTFKDFGLDQPSVPVLLSVADTIKLEYDFRLTPEASP